MRALRGWLVWRSELYPGENKPRKIPYYCSGGRRRGHQGGEADRAALTDFIAARDAAVVRGRVQSVAEWAICCPATGRVANDAASFEPNDIAP